jgi:hypothetical protein
MPADKVEELHVQYWRLSNLDSLKIMYYETKYSLPIFLQLHNILRVKRITNNKDIHELIELASHGQTDQGEKLLDVPKTLAQMIEANVEKDRQQVDIPENFHYPVHVTIFYKKVGCKSCKSCNCLYSIFTLIFICDNKNIKWLRSCNSCNRPVFISSSECLFFGFCKVANLFYNFVWLLPLN